MFAKLTDNRFQVTVTDVDDFKTAEDLLADGFLPYEETEQPSEVLDSMHYYLAEYYEEDNKIKQRWTVAEYETPQIMVYSKLKILLAAQQAGFVDDLIAFIESNKTVQYIWNASNTIENNEIFMQYLPSVAAALTKTEAEVMEFLNENCVAD